MLNSRQCGSLTNRGHSYCPLQKGILTFHQIYYEASNQVVVCVVLAVLCASSRVTSEN